MSPTTYENKNNNKEFSSGAGKDSKMSKSMTRPRIILEMDSLDPASKISEVGTLVRYSFLLVSPQPLELPIVRYNLL